MAKLTDVKNSEVPVPTKDPGLLKADFLKAAMAQTTKIIQGAETGIIGIVAPPGYGKTTLAATFSDFAPDEWPKERPDEITILEDSFWFLADDAGLGSLKDVGVFPLVVEEIWDRPKTEVEYRQLLKEGATRAEGGVQAGVTKFIVVDTASSLLLNMLEYLNERYKNVDADRQFEKWIELETWVSQFMFSLRMLRVPVIVLFHMKYRQEWVSKKTTAEQKRKLAEKKKTEKLPGQFEIELELQGNRAGRWFYKNCSHIFPMKRDSISDPPLIVTDDSENTVVKTRCKWLDRYEPPHLRKLWKKIRNEDEGEKQ